MERDPLKEEHLLRMKLDEYYVEVPEFPLKQKRTKWERLLHFLASPTQNPLEPIISTTSGFVVLKMAPIIGTLAVTLIQVFYIL